ncbi:hypothetical protein ACFUJ0_06015 [Streptomyces sp. NPDC057242]|uniref:hypothetical protein n=1 Tax=unclassified Streptomyces TaxID=2593676 RepID=UPI00362549C9
MSTQWQSNEYGPLIGHLAQLRRTGRYLGTRRGPGRCGSCKGARRVVLVGADKTLAYSAPCLGCDGDGTTDRAGASA